jgi:hypothetical protein
MDPIHPIAPGPPPIAPASRLPVEPLERITRERDRPARDDQGRHRRTRNGTTHDGGQAGEPPAEPEQGPEDEDGGRPHVDVRA